MLKMVLENEDQEDPVTNLEDQHTPLQHITTIIVRNSIPIEIEPGKVLNINGNLDDDQQQKLKKFLWKYQGAFAWDYTNMKGLYPQLCTHHIYTDKEIHPIRQP